MGTPADQALKSNMDDQRAITVDSTTDLHQGQRPRANFPLPRELRDMFYGHLLDGKHTRVKRARVGNNAYKFHTSILGVSRQIHDEAQECLYGQNVFVVVSHQFSDTSHAAIPSWVPMVTELHGTKIMHRSLNVHLSDQSHDTSTISETPKRTWLFLFRDLDAYCLGMTRRQALRINGGPYLLLYGNNSLLEGPVNNTAHQRGLDHLRLDLCSQHFRKSSHELQRRLISPFRKVVIPNVLVRICGDLLDRNSANNLEIEMGPSLFCANALKWRLLW